MPRIASYSEHRTEIPFDLHGLIGVIAPRPVFIRAPLRDSNFQWQSVRPHRRLRARNLRPVWCGCSAPLEHPDCEQELPDAQRETAFELLDSALKRESRAHTNVR